jgi:hypothetical protein
MPSYQEASQSLIPLQITEEILTALTLSILLKYFFLKYQFIFQNNDFVKNFTDATPPSKQENKTPLLPQDYTSLWQKRGSCRLRSQDVNNFKMISFIELSCSIHLLSRIALILPMCFVFKVISFYLKQFTIKKIRTEAYWFSAWLLLSPQTFNQVGFAE